MSEYDDWRVVAEALEWARVQWMSCSCDDGEMCEFCRVARAEQAVLRLISSAVASAWPAGCERVPVSDGLALERSLPRLDALAESRNYPPSPLGLLRMLRDFGFELTARRGSESREAEGVTEEKDQGDDGG